MDQPLLPHPLLLRKCFSVMLGALREAAEVFRYLHTWFGHPGVYWLNVSSSGWGSGDLGGAWMGGGIHPLGNQGLPAPHLAFPAPRHQFRVYGAPRADKVPAHQTSNVPVSGHGRA